MPHHGITTNSRRQGEAEVDRGIIQGKFNSKYSNNTPWDYNLSLLWGVDQVHSPVERITSTEFSYINLLMFFLVIPQSNNNNPGLGILKQTLITHMCYSNTTARGVENTPANIHV